MDRERQWKEYEKHFAALRRLDTFALMHRGRLERARAVRGMLVCAARQLRTLAGSLSSRLARTLQRRELARYDERLLRDMGISAYDIGKPRRSVIEMVATWLDRSRQRKQLARFTERDLCDIATSKCDADTEIEKPFWRA
jgi:uncharacterized protein YjiS (DUF1127 family)